MDASQGTEGTEGVEVSSSPEETSEVEEALASDWLWKAALEQAYQSLLREVCFSLVHEEGACSLRPVVKEEI